MLTDQPESGHTAMAEALSIVADSIALGQVFGFAGSAVFELKQLRN
jgi:hypothetical protein